MCNRTSKFDVSHRPGMTATRRRFAFCRGSASFRGLGETDVHSRPCRQPERSALACRTIQCLAVRAGESDCRAAEKDTEGRGAVRDRLRSFGPAAYRHLRRGRAHHHGAARLPRADRGQDQDTAARLLRRHGRPAQGAGQRAEQGTAGAAFGQTADAGARSLWHPRKLWRAQQCAAARVPRHLRLRIRVRQLDRLLHVGKIRRRAVAHAGADRKGDGDHAAVVARRARRELLAIPAHLSAHRPRALRAGDGA